MLLLRLSAVEIVMLPPPPPGQPWVQRNSRRQETEKGNNDVRSSEGYVIGWTSNIHYYVFGTECFLKFIS